MPRNRRLCPAGYPAHVMQRGLNRQLCFTSDAEIAAYANWLREGALKFNVKIHGWVFMTNHVHLLMTPGSNCAVSRLMQYLGRLYVRQFNYRHQRSGSLFDGRFRASVIQSDRYLLTCLRYIELNPIRAGMVKDPADYRWSSYVAHGLGRAPELWSPHPLYVAMGNSAEERQKRYRQLIAMAIEPEVIEKIRGCTNTGLVLGTSEFRRQFEDITGDERPPFE